MEPIIKRLKEKVPVVHAPTAADWDQGMCQGLVCYGRPISFDTRRIYLNAANKFWKYLKPDYSNLYEAVVKSIEDHQPSQYSSRKHCKEAGISLAKYLIYKGVINA
jgi:hypothetical protein